MLFREYMGSYSVIQEDAISCTSHISLANLTTGTVKTLNLTVEYVFQLEAYI